MPSLVINGTEFYSAPKNAGTTVRMWAKQFETGLRDSDLCTGGYDTLASVGLPRIWSDVSGDLTWPVFRPTESQNLKWCIKRDPLDRFVSGYTDKILRERLAIWTIDECVEMLESGEMERLAASRRPHWLAALHLVPQVAWLGTTTTYFQRVFDIAAMDRVREFCESHVFKMPLGRLHARNLSCSDTPKVSLTAGQRRRLESIFAPDYRAGWC